jgi:hypothetical protein
MSTNIKESLSATLPARKPILDQIRDPQCSHKAPQILKHIPKLNEVKQGFDDELLSELSMNDTFTKQQDNNMVSKGHPSNNSAGPSMTNNTVTHLTHTETLSKAS